MYHANNHPKVQNIIKVISGQWVFNTFTVPFVWSPNGVHISYLVVTAMMHLNSLLLIVMPKIVLIPLQRPSLGVGVAEEHQWHNLP